MRRDDRPDRWPAREIAKHAMPARDRYVAAGANRRWGGLTAQRLKRAGRAAVTYFVAARILSAPCAISASASRWPS